MQGLFRRKGAKQSQAKENDTEILLTAMRKLIQGSCIRLEENISCSNETVTIWNTMVDKIQNDKKNTTMMVNELLRTVMEMDFVRDILSDTRYQSASFQSISASSQEMAASINDISSFAQNVNLNANHVVDISTESTDKINQTISFVRNSFIDIENISSQMKNVTEETKKINSIADTIKGIAEQTNLLALNAAIESARAGEAGKGFAVVADEIRKLSDNTRLSVGEVQKSIAELLAQVENVSSTAMHANSRLESGEDLINTTLESVSKLKQSINGINEDILQISANAEEQTAATEEVSAEISSLSGKTEEITNVSEKVGKSIFDLSNSINSIRIESIKSSNCLTEKDLLDLCIVDHLLWVWRVYNMILGHEKIEVSAVNTHTECRLGQWYYNVKNSAIKGNKTFMDIEQPHSELHKYAKEAIKAYSEKNIALSEELLSKMTSCSKQIISSLNEIKKVI